MYKAVLKSLGWQKVLLDNSFSTDLVLTHIYMNSDLLTQNIASKSLVRIGIIKFRMSTLKI